MKIISNKPFYYWSSWSHISKYYKGFLLNSINCVLKHKKFVWNFSSGQHFWSYTSQNFCIICQSYNSSLEITKSILEKSLVTLIDRCKKRRYYKDRKLTEFTDRIENISVVDIIKQNEFYHRECYKTFWNLNEVKIAEKRFSGLNNDKKSAQIMLETFIDLVLNKFFSWNMKNYRCWEDCSLKHKIRDCA